MRADVLTEPSLEFAGGARHVDPRFGVAEYGPADLSVPSAPRSIKVGTLGTQASLDQLRDWLERARIEIEGKSPDRPGLWPAFPGFIGSAGYRAEFVLDARLEQPLSARSVELLSQLHPGERIARAVELYLEALQALVQQGRPDVVICVIPDALLDLEADPAPGEPDDSISHDTAESAQTADFHDLLKARAMPLRVPLQLIRPSTYDPSQRKRQKRRTWKVRQRQDDASIAWNFFTALYNKAGGT